MEPSKSKKIVIASGGTGGHLYPSIVLTQYLRKMGHSVFLVLGINPNRKTPFVLPSEIDEIPFEIISSSPFTLHSPWQNITSFFRNFTAFYKGFFILNRTEAECVIGFGSYASFPILLAAFFKRIPIILHEQNLIPGWANRVCYYFAKKVAISFSESASYFPNKSILTGNLVRSNFFSDRNSASEKNLPIGLEEHYFTLLVFGGSSGSKRINQLLLNTAQSLTRFKNKIQIIQITGSKEESVKLFILFKKLGIKNHILEYAHEISKLYHCADLVVCRAGASTITELIASKLPAILIPYPYAVGNHQLKNAMLLSKIGSAIILTEDTVNLEDSFAKLIENLIQKPEKLDIMRKSYEFYPVPLEEAPKKLAEIIFSQCL